MIAFRSSSSSQTIFLTCDFYNVIRRNKEGVVHRHCEIVIIGASSLVSKMQMTI